jgi:hypothetical protein
MRKTAADLQPARWERTAVPMSRDRSNMSGRGNPDEAARNCAMADSVGWLERHPLADVSADQ